MLIGSSSTLLRAKNWEPFDLVPRHRVTHSLSYSNQPSELSLWHPGILYPEPLLKERWGKKAVGPLVYLRQVSIRKSTTWLGWLSG